MKKTGYILLLYENELLLMKANSLVNKVFTLIKIKNIYVYIDILPVQCTLRVLSDFLLFIK